MGLANGGAPQFDFNAGQNSSGAQGGIDWQSGSGGWTNSYSPFDSGKGGKSSVGNFADFLVKLVKGGGSGYDAMGSELTGKGGKAQK
jgi:hypothetical protein